MEVAAGIVSFLSISGQCLQGCMWLYDFFSDIKHAPKTVADIGEEVRLMLYTLASFHQTLKDIESQQTVPNGRLSCLSDAKPALSLCRSTIEDLVIFVTKHPGVSACAGNDPGSFQGRWKSIDFAFRKSKFKEHVAKLQQAKISLLAVQCNILIAINSAQSKELQDTKQALLNALDQHAAKIVMAVGSLPASAPSMTQQLYENNLAHQKEMRMVIILPLLTIVLCPLSLGATILLA